MSVFTQIQLHVLRRAYGLIDQMTPDAREALGAMLVRLPAEALVQLSTAQPQIAWVSRAAGDRLAHLKKTCS